MLTRENLRAYLDRDWAGQRRSKDRAMYAWVARHGTTAALRAGQDMLEQVWDRVSQQPSDLSGLLELRKKLDRANARRAPAPR